MEGFFADVDLDNFEPNNKKAPAPKVDADALTDIALQGVNIKPKDEEQPVFSEPEPAPVPKSEPKPEPVPVPKAQPIPEPAPAKAPTSPKRSSSDASEEVVISKNAKIKGGSLETPGDVRIDGIFIGDMSSGGNIKNNHKISASTIEALKVDLAEGSITKGNITAAVVTIAGALKGNVTATEKIVAKSTALIMGDLTSPALTLEDGASIDGMCHRLGGSQTPTEFFENLGGDD